MNNERIDTLDKFEAFACRAENSTYYDLWIAQENNGNAANEETFWLARDYIRMHNGDWTPLDFNLPDAIPAWTFPHVSISNDSQHLIAYNENERKGKSDIKIRGKFGKFLRRFCPEIPDHVIAQEWVPVWNKMVGAREVKITSDPDEVALIYKYGPRSCMDGEHFSRIHNSPVRVYSTEDVGVAYIGNLMNERITARSVVNLKNRHFIRCYGDPMLAEFLKANGYTEGNLQNCRIRRIPHPNDDNMFFVPYIDNTAIRVRWPTKEEDPYGFYLIVDERGPTQARSLSGSVTLSDRKLPHMVNCTKCCNARPGKSMSTALVDGDTHLLCTSCKNVAREYIQLDGSKAYTFHRDQLFCNENRYYRIEDAESLGFIKFSGKYYPLDACTQCAYSEKWVPIEHPSLIEVTTVSLDASNNYVFQNNFVIESMIARHQAHINPTRDTTPKRPLYVPLNNAAYYKLANDPAFIDLPSLIPRAFYEGTKQAYNAMMDKKTSRYRWKRREYKHNTLEHIITVNTRNHLNACIEDYLGDDRLKSTYSLITHNQANTFLSTLEYPHRRFKAKTRLNHIMKDLKTYINQMERLISQNPSILNPPFRANASECTQTNEDIAA